ncbi:MAG: DEAD/DEAH box helicase [Oscillospiraceae bacterium]
MDNQTIISKVNSYLYKSSTLLVKWLEGVLPQVSDSWWNDCVLESLSYNQRERAKSQGFVKLSDFDLAALLRIANSSWYDMITVTPLPASKRETIRGMLAVRNNWAHISTEFPGKDSILADLSVISSFMRQFNGDNSVIDDIDEFIELIEEPDSIREITANTQANTVTETDAAESTVIGTIQEKSLVYLVSAPEIKGIVFAVHDLGETKKYDVFVDGSIRTYYSGQISPVEETVGYNWIDLDTFRSYLTAYQIKNPSSQNLYSLNSARIDFVPYQFRPALKMIHSDEPRILIADSVGVGKTIEAGLIIKELEARNELERILVICPRPLVSERKWELEMKRFDEDFIPVDGGVLRQIISDTDRDGEWPIRYSKVIIPYSILDRRVYFGDDSGRRHSFGLNELNPKPHFDLVIIDEAHHIRNGSLDKDKAFAYKCTKFFCDNADAVVMLTATPLQTGDDDLFTLLNVLRPDVVIDKKTFELMAKPNRYISKAVRSLRAAEDGWRETAIREMLDLRRTQWGDNVVAENPLYNDIMNRLGKDEITREERVKLISDIESLHSFNTMINRTRRRDIQDFCVRRSHTISVEFTEYQQQLHDELLSFESSALSLLHNSRAVSFMMTTIKRQAASCIFGLAPHIRNILERRLVQISDNYDCDWSDMEMDEQSADAFSDLAKRILELADNLPETDPKYEQTLQIIKSKSLLENNKVMIFSTFRYTLAYLRSKLLNEGFRVVQIDGSVKDETRYEMKNRFELPKENTDAIDILLFTEVGSEGLDYQFCDLMINYDLPWNPMRIEQRIGRIDRRGQQSEAVNIYNIITENTIDADIYYRCLLRIGIFESHIGDCEEILGSIGSKIEDIALDANLTDQERKTKLEQIADNEVRKAQELIRLEEEEKELFGFDLTEFTTSQEIRSAENPWLTPSAMRRLVEHYLRERIGTGTYILGESPLKTLRLSASARKELLDDFRKLSGSRNMLKRKWESYLSGKIPNHSVTFDSEAASQDRDSFFITPMHPLAKQAAIFFSKSETGYLKLEYHSSLLPEGTYLFSVYAWQYTGINSYTKLVTVCEDEMVEKELTDIFEAAQNLATLPDMQPDWSSLEGKQITLWTNARSLHKQDMDVIINSKIEILTNIHRNSVRSLEQQIIDASDESIRRMKKGELEGVKETFDKKISDIKAAASRADIFTTLLANGVIVVKGE